MLWIAICVIGVAALEFVARWVIRRGPYRVWSPGTRRFLRPDPAIHPEIGTLVRFEINSDGERGNRLGNRRAVFRVLVGGGSTVECFPIDQSGCWTGVLERELRGPEQLRSLGAVRVHVGNIGRSGVDSRTMVRILSAVLPNYHHLDAVVIMVGASDVLRWIVAGAEPDRLPPEHPVSAFFAEHPMESFSWRPQHWGLSRLARRAWHRVWRPRRPEPIAGRWLQRARLMRQRAREVRDTTPDATAVVAGFRANFRQILLLAQSAAPHVLVVRQPWFDKPAFTAEEEAMFWNGGLGEAYRDQIDVYYSSRVICDLMGQIDSAAAEVADHLGVLHVDLRPQLEMSTRTFYDHFHFTPSACERTGSIVAGAIISSVRRRRSAAVFPRENVGSQEPSA